MTVDSVSESESPPLADGGIPIRNIWHMLLYAWDQTMVTDRWRAEVETAPHLDGLLASILEKLVQQRLRVGLGRDYLQKSGLLRTLRGRIDFGRSVKGLTLQHNQLYCHFHEFSADVPKNQIIRNTLNRIVRIGEFGQDRTKSAPLKHRLRRLVRDLDQIQVIELNLDLIRRQNLGRNDRDYGLMLAICELLLRRHMPMERAGSHFLPSVDRDASTLYRVFERFVAQFYRMRLEGWTVTAQASLDWHTKKACENLPEMRPDLVLEHKSSGKIVILDTKFTKHILAGSQYRSAVFQSEHIYQIYAYLRSQEQRSMNHRSSTGVLLYPAANHHLAERVQLQGHRIDFRTINLALPWEEIERDLLALITEQVLH